MRVVVLITQRSRVQIPPPLPGSAGQRPDRQDGGRASQIVCPRPVRGISPLSAARPVRDWQALASLLGVRSVVGSQVLIAGCCWQLGQHQRMTGRTVLGLAAHLASGSRTRRCVAPVSVTGPGTARRSLLVATKRRGAWVGQAGSCWVCLVPGAPDRGRAAPARLPSHRIRRHVSSAAPSARTPRRFRGPPASPRSGAPDRRWRVLA
jgi:hypothetical protein